MNKKNDKKLRYNILLAFISFLFTGFFLELLLRFVEPSGVIDRFWRRNTKTVASGNYFVKFNKQLGWFSIPKLQAERVDPKGDFRCNVKINSKGLRDYEYSYQKASETYRILLLGDSFTQATQVNLEHTVAKQLETKFSRKKSKDSFQVISGGVIAFGTDQEYLFYETEGYKYQADLVLLMLYIGNDVRNNSYKLETFYRDGKVYKPFFEIRDKKLVRWLGKMNSGYGIPRFESIPFQWLQIHSVLFRQLSYNISSISFLRKLDFQLSRFASHEVLFDIDSLTLVPHMPLDYNLFYSPLPSAWEESWKVTEELILNLQKAVLQQGSRFGVVIIPTAIQVDETLRIRQFQSLSQSTISSLDLVQPDERLHRFLKSQDISYIWLLPHFHREFRTYHRSFYYPNNLHWNADGHSFAADILFHWIRDLFLDK